MVNGKPILELFEPRTYTASCRTLRNALLVDSINLRKTMRIQGGHGLQGQIRTCIPIVPSIMMMERKESQENII
ncbi:hypothetical protein TNCV_937361 [Trichonephila clavipes]|nr:hypothetical protein TNCV_937361 [Trichonephila clavipes]